MRGFDAEWRARARGVRLHITGTASCQLAVYVYVMFGNTLEYNKSASGVAYALKWK